MPYPYKARLLDEEETLFPAPEDWPVPVAPPVAPTPPPPPPKPWERDPDEETLRLAYDYALKQQDRAQGSRNRASFVAGITGKPADYGAAEGLEKAGQIPLQQAKDMQKQRIEGDLDNPNSPTVQTAYGIMKRVGMDMPPGMTMRQVTAVFPQIKELFDLEERKIKATKAVTDPLDPENARRRAVLESQFPERAKEMKDKGTWNLLAGKDIEAVAHQWQQDKITGITQGGSDTRQDKAIKAGLYRQTTGQQFTEEQLREKLAREASGASTPFAGGEFKVPEGVQPPEPQVLKEFKQKAQQAEVIISAAEKTKALLRQIIANPADRDARAKLSALQPLLAPTINTAMGQGAMQEHEYGRVKQSIGDIQTANFWVDAIERALGSPEEASVLLHKLETTQGFFRDATMDASKALKFEYTPARKKGGGSAVAKTPGTVRMVDPDGKTFDVPANHVEDAIKNHWKRA